MSKTPHISFCIVSPDPDCIERLGSHLAGRPDRGVSLVYDTCEPAALLLNLHRFNPTCFLIDLQLGEAAVQELTVALQRAGYSHFIFLGGEGPRPDLPGEVLPAEASPISLLAAIARTGVRRGEASPRTEAGTGTHRRPTVITVHSPKGGSGKTLIACSLATQFAAKGVRTLLVDLALYGGVAPSLGLLRRDKGLGPVIETAEHDPALLTGPGLGELLRDNIVRFPAGEHRLDVLLAGAPLKIAKLGLEQADQLFRWLTSEPYDIIVVDTSSEIAERTAVALRVADFALLLMTPELSAAWALLGMQDLLKNLSAGGRLQVVVNRSLPGLRTRELEEVIGYPVVAQIPEVQHPWEKAVGIDLRWDYSAMGLSLKRLAQQLRSIYSIVEIPPIKR